MIIDLSEIIRNVDEKIDIDCDIAFDDTKFMGDLFTFEKPLHVKGHIPNNSKSLELNAIVTGEMGVECARCRKPLSVPVNFDIEEVIMQDTGEDAAEDVILISDEKLDIYDIIANNFFMNVEGKYLCSDDCKGLCPKCGADLNVTQCDCDADEIDPRWAKLAEIMKNSSDTK